MSDLTFRWLFQQSELGLRRLVGTNTEQRTFTTVHVSELRNPAEFTLPGAIIMLVGLDFVDKRGEFATYVRVLADAGVAGIGFGTGIAFADVPEELVDAATQHDLVLCEVPRPTPFLSVMSAVSREQTRREQERQNVLRKQQEKLSAAAWRGGLDDVCRVGARELAAAVAVVGESGEVWAQAGGAMGLQGARMQQKIELPGRVAAMLVVEAAGKFDAYARALIKHLAGLAGLLVHRSAQDHAGPAEALGALVLSTLLAGEVGGVRESPGDRAEAGPAGSTAVSRQRDLLADAMGLVASRGEVVFAGLVADRSDELAATITAYVQGAAVSSHRSAARSGAGPVMCCGFLIPKRCWLLIQKIGCRPRRSWRRIFLRARQLVWRSSGGRGVVLGRWIVIGCWCTPVRLPRGAWRSGVRLRLRGCACRGWMLRCDGVGKSCWLGCMRRRLATSKRSS
ncbi:PucR family transcriptional regulator ligand-binding domain-containing protein [Corynebacterium propinquum]|uniref:PucR family transcriptional regulator ligand-binding domain-containing protein n=1 Tax=Corynebacterium propinquum TaxID=43769 RepID=UPI002549CD20|nr:PucR family transcriptional regulator ligand-binding domain-containing protein [Corynebacterium propinquum]MDK8534835.1 PucR family transcriptional regulator ligand-binding domain-containing protein [Corynebacterium propinquum]